MAGLGSWVTMHSRLEFHPLRGLNALGSPLSDPPGTRQTRPNDPAMGRQWPGNALTKPAEPEPMG